MALITDFASLQANIADYLNRDDLTAVIPTFIQLCEKKIARNVRRKTIRNAAFSLAAESNTLPNDCAEVRSVIPVTGTPFLDRALRIVTQPMWADAKALNWATSGRPCVASVIDTTTLLIAPPPDQTYTAILTYYQSLAPLSNSNTTNTVLTEAPDIYLYGSLAEAAPYLEHDARIQVWKGAFYDAMAELDTQRQREETAAALHIARLPTHF